MTSAHRQPWTPEDLDTLRRLWPTTEGYEVARQLGRTHASVCRKACRLGIQAVCGRERGCGVAGHGLYGVYISDPGQRGDRLVARRGTRAGAIALERRLNAELLAKHGRPTPGRPVPLAYCVSEQMGRNAS